MVTPCDGRIVGTSNNIHRTISQGLHKWFPKARYDIRREGKTYDFIWEADTGSTMDLLTYDMAPKEHEGSDKNWILLDEPPPQILWGAFVSRLRRGGYIYIFMTPMGGAGWLFEMMEKAGVSLTWEQSASPEEKQLMKIEMN